jgi:peptide subunit release factor 1 (eRF1)
VLQNFYRCDKVFHVGEVKPLWESRRVMRSYGLVWCGRSQSQSCGDTVECYQFFASGELVRLKVHTAHLKNSHKKGGQSQKRFERLVDQQRTAYSRHVAESIVQVLQDHDITRVFVAGSAAKATELSRCLTNRSPNLNVDTVTIGDHQTPVQVIKTLTLDSEGSATDTLLQDFFRWLCTKRVVYGRDQTLHALANCQLKYLFSTLPEDEKLADEQHCTFVYLDGTSSLQAQFIKQFGGCGGIAWHEICSEDDCNPGDDVDPEDAYNCEL